MRLGGVGGDGGGGVVTAPVSPTPQLTCPHATLQRRAAAFTRCRKVYRRSSSAQGVRRRYVAF